MKVEDIVIGKRYCVVGLNGQRDNLIVIGQRRNNPGLFAVLKGTSTLYISSGRPINDLAMADYQINYKYNGKEYWVISNIEIENLSIIKTKCKVCGN